MRMCDSRLGPAILNITHHFNRGIKMARLFTWKQIQNGYIPTTKGFEETIHEITRVLTTCSGVRAAQIFGSTAKKQASVCSDIDVIVVYDYADLAAAVAFRHLHTYAAERFVPLELIPVNEDAALTLDHNIDILLLEHLGRNPQVAILNPVVDLLTVPKETYASAAQLYLRRKRGGFEKLLYQTHTMDGDELARSLGKVLSFPIYAARKILQALGYRFPHGDGKSEVLRNVSQHPKVFGDTRLLRRVTEIEWEYSTSIVAGTMTKEKNKEFFSTVVSYIPMVIELGRAYLEVLHRLESKAD